jgi:hypothetical protein
MKFRTTFPIFVFVVLAGCARHEASYQVVSYSGEPVHEFVLQYQGRRIVTTCCMPKNRDEAPSCAELQSKVGQTVEMEYMKFGNFSSHVLVYHPNVRDDGTDHFDEMLCLAP